MLPVESCRSKFCVFCQIVWERPEVKCVNASCFSIIWVAFSNQYLEQVTSSASLYSLPEDFLNRCLALLAFILTCCYVNKIGKKQCLVFGYLPRIASAFIYLFATNYEMLLISRFLNGITDFSTVITVGPYVAEIASVSVIIHQ